MADLALLLGKPKPADDDDGPPSSEDMSREEHSSAMDDAADEMFDAFKKGNRQGFRDALSGYVSLHQTMPEEEDSGDDDNEPDEKGLLSHLMKR